MGALDEYIQSEYVNKQIEQSGDTHFVCTAAEENILRRMLKSQNIAEDVAAAMSAKDFSNLDYGRLFNAIQDVLRAERTVDAITVQDSAERLFPKCANRLRNLIVVLMKYREPTVEDTHDVRDHVAIVKALARRRNAIKTVGELMNQLYTPSKDIDETLLAIRDAVDNSGVDKASSVSLQEVLWRTFDYMERRQKGEIKSITTGLKCIDRIIGGFYGGELTVIGARPSVGKSAFGANIALAAAREGHKVGIVSCEMVDIGFGQRIFSHGAWVDGMAIRRGEIEDEDWVRIADVIGEYGELPIEFVFDSTYIEDIVQWATRKAKRGELDMLVVDYLQLMDTRKRFDSEHLRVGYISRALKKLALQCNIPVIALAQVNRETDGSMPTLKHLKDSGSIEQDCDGVLFLHRPSKADDSFVDPRDRAAFDGFADRDTVYLCIAIAKQRQGAIGRACVVFDPAYMRYIEIERSDENASKQQ